MAHRPLRRLAGRLAAVIAFVGSAAGANEVACDRECLIGRSAVSLIRLRAAANQVHEVETIVAREGTASLFAPEAMTTPDVLFEQEVAPARRASRADMIAIANSYYEGIVRADPSLVPAAAGCYRVENGVQTQRIPSLVKAGHCNAGHGSFGYITPIRNRRFPLVDPERGLVLALTIMDIRPAAAVHSVDGHLQQAARSPRSILVGELFKIVDRKIRRMEVVMRDVESGAVSGWSD